MTCGTWDGDYTLGPFFDEDGTEILPCTTEATADLLAECMGYYDIRSDVPDLHSATFLLCNRLLTACIQENWNEVMGRDLSDGFPLAHRSPHKAVGRLAEQLWDLYLGSTQDTLRGRSAPTPRFAENPALSRIVQRHSCGSLPRATRRCVSLRWWPPMDRRVQGRH